MAHRLRALAAPSEDLGSIPTICTVAHDFLPSSGLTECKWCTDTHAAKTSTYMKKVTLQGKIKAKNSHFHDLWRQTEGILRPRAELFLMQHLKKHEWPNWKPKLWTALIIMAATVKHSPDSPAHRTVLTATHIYSSWTLTTSWVGYWLFWTNGKLKLKTPLKYSNGKADRHLVAGASYKLS